MAKKNNGDKSLVMSKEYFDSLTLLNPENISQFFGHASVFFEIDVDKTKFSILNAFFIDRQRTKGNYNYKFYWDSSVRDCVVKMSANESDNEFRDRLIEQKRVISRGMSNKSIYGKRID